LPDVRSGLFSVFVASFSLVYSPTSIGVALVCCTLIGLAFGYVPARNAASLDPALSR
jgi:macrolide transport system ATP-binding/permease protein